MHEIRVKEAELAREKEKRYEREVAAAKRVEFTAEMTKEIEREKKQREKKFKDEQQKFEKYNREIKQNEAMEEEIRARFQKERAKREQRREALENYMDREIADKTTDLFVHQLKGTVKDTSV